MDLCRKGLMHKADVFLMSEAKGRSSVLSGYQSLKSLIKLFLY